jgi:hypothetical protein
MPDARSLFINRDHDILTIKLYSVGTEAMKLPKGDSEHVDGTSGDVFSFAWKNRDESITDEEFQDYGITATYGENFIFGSPAGQIP